MKQSGSYLIFVLIVIALAFGLFYFYPSETSTIKFDGVKATARQTNKQILVIFHASWCVPCKKFESTTLQDPRVKQALTNYVIHYVDIDTDHELDKYLGNDGIPTFVVLRVDVDGIKSLVRRITGYQNAEQFLDFLNVYYSKS